MKLIERLQIKSSVSLTYAVRWYFSIHINYLLVLRQCTQCDRVQLLVLEATSADPTGLMLKLHRAVARDFKINQLIHSYHNLSFEFAKSRYPQKLNG